MSKLDVIKTEDNEGYKINFFLTKIIDKNIKEVKLSRFIVKAGKESLLDQHSEKEKWYIAKGNGVLVISGDKKVSVKEGDLFFFDSMISHKVYNTSQNDLEILSIWW